MSTLDVANLSDAESTTTNTANSIDVLNNTTTVDTKYITNGCAKVWINLVGSGNLIRNSLNVASLTDNGLGDYSINYTSTMVDGNGAASALSSRDASPDQVGMFQGNVLNANYFRITEIASDAFYGPNIVTASLLGELA